MNKEQLENERAYILKKLEEVDERLASMNLISSYDKHKDFIYKMRDRFLDLLSDKMINLTMPATINVETRVHISDDYIRDQSNDAVNIMVFDIGLEDTNVSETEIENLFKEFPSNNSLIPAYEKCKSELKPFKLAYESFIIDLNDYMAAHDLDDDFKEYFINEIFA